MANHEIPLKFKEQRAHVHLSRRNELYEAIHLNNAEALILASGLLSFSKSVNYKGCEIFVFKSVVNTYKYLSSMRHTFEFCRQRNKMDAFGMESR